MRKIEQVNEFLLRELSLIISRELPLEDGFISISSVKCSPDLLSAKVKVLVLPDHKAGTALKKLRGHSSMFAKILQKKIRFHHIPKFNWIIDPSGREADEMESLFNEIKNE
ncbi:MAG: 30S ribosome-binding factor RbfA [Patescibacteria group bacterium]|jgi:ribosome-binding factor A